MTQFALSKVIVSSYVSKTFVPSSSCQHMLQAATNNVKTENTVLQEQWISISYHNHVLRN